MALPNGVTRVMTAPGIYNLCYFAPGLWGDDALDSCQELARSITQN